MRDGKDRFQRANGEMCSRIRDVPETGNMMLSLPRGMPRLLGAPLNYNFS
jgi:hypothetical protein